MLEEASKGGLYTPLFSPITLLLLDHPPSIHLSIHPVSIIITNTAIPSISHSTTKTKTNHRRDPAAPPIHSSCHFLVKAIIPIPSHPVRSHDPSHPPLARPLFIPALSSTHSRGSPMASTLGEAFFTCPSRVIPRYLT